MGDVSKGEGRTVLFVSHNMAAIQNLCKNSLLLKNGKLTDKGETPLIIKEYLKQYSATNTSLSEITNRSGSQKNSFKEIQFLGRNFEKDNIESFENFTIILELEKEVDWQNFKGQIDIGINNNMGDRIAWLSTSNKDLNAIKKSNIIKFTVHHNPLAPGNYTCNLHMVENNEVVDWIMDVAPFTVAEKDYYNSGKLTPKNQGNILLNYSI